MRSIGRFQGQRLAAALLLTSALGVACGSARPAGAFELFGLRFFEREDDSQAEVVDPVRYTVRLQVAGQDAALSQDLSNASTLVAEAGEPVSGSLGLLSRARNDRRRLVAALFENARYEGLVDIFIEGRNVADLPPDARFDTAAGPVPVIIQVRPGRVFTLGAVRVTAGGVPLDPSQYELAPGGSAASVDVLEAESNIFRDLRDDGRPFVAVTERSVVADVPPARLDYTLGLSTGPRVPFGTTYVQGARAVDPGFIAYMAGIERGTVFSPKEMDRSRERLQKLGVFSSVTVKEAQAQSADGTLPVQVEVGERKFGFYGLGATYSNTEGAGASGYVGYRNLFGRAESIRLDAAVGRVGATALSGEAREREGIDFSGSLVFTKPGVLGPDSVYVGSLEVKREQPLAYDRETYAATSGVQYEIDENQSLEVRLRGEYEEITDYLGVDSFTLLSVPATYTFDNRDNELNPTSGFRFQAFVEPTYEFQDEKPFLKARLDASTYLSPFESDRFVLAARLAYGNVFGADLQDVPNDRRFYAGGGGSVRGYEFQSIGPYYPSTVPPGSGFVERFVDTPTGGLTLFEGSLEARIGITETIQIVPFVDGGSVSDDLAPDFSNLKFGAGVGARYLTSFGPIRVDVGVPLDPGPRDASFQFYAGIGQAF